MSAEGVMVSYNYSDEDHTNILTVSASGIKYSNRWVLTHGSFLSPLKQVEILENTKNRPILNDEFYNSLPDVFVTCEKGKSKTPTAYETVERLSRERSIDSNVDLEHSSYRMQVLTGRICHVWHCPILTRCVDDIFYSWVIGYREGNLEDQDSMGKALLSAFVLVDLECDDRGLRTLRPLSELLDAVHPPPARGATVELHSTPFGCEVFLNSVTRGSVCGVVGRRPCLLLTDAAAALGSEGGPVYDGDERSQNLFGMVINSVSWCRGEWVGLTLVAPLLSAVSAKLRVELPPAPPLFSPQPYRNILDSIDSTTVMIRCGAAWGAGVFVGSGLVLTCAHVIKNHTLYKLYVYWNGVREKATVRYKTDDDKPYDLALISMSTQAYPNLQPAIFAEEPARKGESVLAAGYPYFTERHLEQLQPTVTSGHVSNVSPSLLQTSCCVQSGFSGGPVFRLTSDRALVEVVGVLVSTAKADTGACFPYVNMAVPAVAFAKALRHFLLHRDSHKLSAMENNTEAIQSQWRLLPYRSKI